MRQKLRRGCKLDYEHVVQRSSVAILQRGGAGTLLVVYYCAEAAALWLGHLATGSRLNSGGEATMRPSPPVMMHSALCDQWQKLPLAEPIQDQMKV